MNWPDLVKVYHPGWLSYARRRLRTLGLQRLDGLEAEDVVHYVVLEIYDWAAADPASGQASAAHVNDVVRRKIRNRVGYESRRRRIRRARYAELGHSDSEGPPQAHEAILSDLGSDDRFAPERRSGRDYHGLLTLALEVGYDYCEGQNKAQVWAVAQSRGTAQREIARRHGVSDATVSKYNHRFEAFHLGFVAELLGVHIEPHDIPAHLRGWFGLGRAGAVNWIDDQPEEAHECR